MSRNQEQTKLEEVLQRFLQPDYKCKGSDEIYMEKLLSHLSGKSSHLIDLPACKEWIQKILAMWKTKSPEPSLASFALHLMGLFVNDWKRFELLQVTDVVGQVSTLVKQECAENLTVKLAYVRMLSGLLKHDSGCQWIVRTVELLDRLGTDLELAGKIVAHVFDPVTKTKQENAIELACNILDASLGNASPVMARAIHKESLECAVWLCLMGEEDETKGGKISKLLVLVYFAVLERDPNDDKIPYSAIKAMEKKLYNLLALHVSRRSVTNFMNIVVQCQFCWSKIFEAVSNCDQSGAKHFNFDTQFIVFQLLPMMVCLRTKINWECLEMFTNKLFRLTSEDTQRLAYSYRDLLVDQEDKYKFAHQSMLSILQIKNIINRELAVIAYQAFMYNLKDFVIHEPNADGMTGPEFVVQHPEHVNVILDGLTSLIRSFHITWRESVETICLFGFTQLLLRNPDLTPKLSVQGLQLMQVAIQNFMPPNLALLMNTLRDSSIEELGPILRNRMRDAHWEVRDSALEVLQVVTTIAEVKFPAFQEHVLEHELCPLVLVLAMDDDESYVRASAINNNTLSLLQTKMLHILRSESEGIVRREAAALLKEIYTHHKFLKAELTLVFEAMARAAVSDLHWEVKVNALHFWEKVIERQMSDQGMIDGVFPSVTFSKENRKIVMLTETEIRTRLGKVLDELARIRCLQVLVSALQDHDIQVVYRAADIISMLNKVLSRHGLTSETSTSQPLPDLVRNCTPPNFRGVYDSYGCQVNGLERKIPSSHADQIIDSIVKESDLSLLARLSMGDQPSSNAPSSNAQKNVTVDEFLGAISQLNVEELVANKSEWLDSCNNNLSSLLDDFLASHMDREANAMDCY
ncbi:hypothetical protein C0J52_11616 [Blattella germanica]|nr:hypothetical protein C0J52_11616 [Blattella germanica]